MNKKLSQLIQIFFDTNCKQPDEDQESESTLEERYWRIACEARAELEKLVKACEDASKYKRALEEIAKARRVDYDCEDYCDGGNFDDTFEMGVEQGEWYAAEIALEALGLPVPETDEDESEEDIYGTDDE